MLKLPNLFLPAAEVLTYRMEIRRVLLDTILFSLRSKFEAIINKIYGR